VPNYYYIYFLIVNIFTVLGIEHCARVTDYVLAEFVKNTQKLRFLSLDGCNSIGAETFSELQKKSHLQDLFVNTCSTVDDGCMKKLLCSVTQVEYYQY
jgi:hypothetical protein